MSSKTAPYGTWKSPITPQNIVEASITFDAVLVDPVTHTIYHVEKRPSEQGRSVIVETLSKTDVFGGGWNSKSMVHGYGGGAQVAYNGIIYFSNFPDGRVYQTTAGTEPKAITPVCTIDKDGNPVDRYGDFSVHPSYPNLVVAIFEHHPDDVPAHVENSLCVIDARSGTISKLLIGNDFYTSPRISPDGSCIAYQTWNFPDMPWQGSEIYVAELCVPSVVKSASDVTVKKPTYVAGKFDAISAVYPAWVTENELFFTSDASGFQNPWTWTKSSGTANALLAEAIDEDFGAPQWNLGHMPFAILDSRALFAAYRDGRTVFYLIGHTGSHQVIEIECPFVDIPDMCCVQGHDNLQFVFIGQKSDNNDGIFLGSIAVNNASPAKYEVLKTTDINPDWRDYISPPEPLAIPLPSAQGPLTVYAVLYLPKNPDYSGSSIPDEKPPCVVGVHGGPTDMANQKLNWTKQMYTSRGYAWLDVNYGGSSGYGRKYIERLRNNWGIVDVQDTIHMAEAVGKQSYVDSTRTVIRGGSSGGYTVLACLANAPVPDNTFFTGGTSYYGISDLILLEKSTHKFESHYLDRLLGGTSQRVPKVYHDRSPVNNAARIKSSLLLLQGLDDTIVPPSQAEAIMKAIDPSVYVEHKFYAGEGHGFQKADNIIDSTQRELSFYAKILNLGS